MTDKDLRDLERKAMEENPALAKFMLAKFRVLENLPKGGLEDLAAKLEKLEALARNLEGSRSEAPPPRPLQHGWTPSTVWPNPLGFAGEAHTGSTKFFLRVARPDHWTSSRKHDQDSNGWPNDYTPRSARIPPNEYSQEEEEYWRAAVVQHVNRVAEVLDQVIRALQDHQIIARY